MDMSSVKTFSEWMAERHPESIDEGILQGLANSRMARNLVAGAALTAGGLGIGSRMMASSPQKPVATAQKDQEDQEDQEEQEDDSEWEDIVAASKRQDMNARRLLAAAKRAGVPKSEWNRLRADKLGGVIVRVNGRYVPLTPLEREIVRDANEQKSAYDRMAAGERRTGAHPKAVTPKSQPSPSQTKPPKSAPSIKRLPGGAGQSADWNPE